MKHLLSIEDLDRAAIERIVALGDDVRRGRRPRDQEGADAPRATGASTSSTRPRRGPQLVRAGRQAAVRRRAQLRLQRLERREGGVAARHRGDALRLRPDAIVIRSPHAGARALVARWTQAAVVNAGDGKHQHPTQALLDVLHARAAARLAGRLLDLDRRRRRCTHASRAPASRRFTSSARRSPSPDRRRSSRASSPARLRVSTTRSTTWARPMSSTRCGCSSSGWTSSFLPSLREYTTNYQINARAAGAAPAPDAPRPRQPRRSSSPAR